MKHNNRKKHSIVDKLIYGFFLISSIALFIADMIQDFIPDEYWQLNLLLMVVGVLSGFFSVLSFMWDKKFSDNIEKITETQENYLRREINHGLRLSKDSRIDSSVLLEYESDLDGLFENKSKSYSKYYIIIITACFDSNETPYVTTIWNNICKGYKYLYVTPNTDQDFINTLITIFDEKKCNDLVNVYEKVTENISHICNKEIFTILPDCFDLCLYFYKDSSIHARGYCSYQNEFIISDEREYSFYYKLSKRVEDYILNIYSDEFNKEHILQPYVSKKLHTDKSSINGKGIFCKLLENIDKDIVVLIKGGFRLHRSEMSSLRVIDSYLPIGDDLFLAAKNKNEEEQIKLYINHSCVPNVRIDGTRAFVSLKVITSGEELTVDYAFVDNEPYRFKCNCGALNCRKIITGFDWQLRKLQKGYKKNYFSAYIQTKIDSGINYECYTKLDERIRHLRREVFVNELQFQEDEEFGGEESHYLHCCLFKKNDLVAYARVKIEAAQARIGRVVVKQGERKKGYGKQIMFWAETEALKHGINNVYVHSLCEAGPFYEKLGYIVDGEQFVEYGRKHILMKKTLILD